MLKPGDKLVCIDNRFEINRLNLHETYTFIDYSFDTFRLRFNYNSIVVKESYIIWRLDRFVSLKEYRKLKLKQIYENR